MLDNPQVIELIEQKSEGHSKVQNLGILHDEGHEQLVPRLLEQLAELRVVSA